MSKVFFRVPLVRNEAPKITAVQSQCLLAEILLVAALLRLIDKARENWALDAIVYTAPNRLAAGDMTAVMAQISEALKCSRSLKVINKLTSLIWRIVKVWVKIQALKGAKLWDKPKTVYD
jgi:hypothetical protein